ncbi:MAG: hypothetical protein HPAVJP_1050 [Candidatus Hepatoplasma vulgare]|nr:MAG: hypothetical protein HPAVJP_1050 [Candidatus Hepatoplasma sp.]
MEDLKLRDYIEKKNGNKLTEKERKNSTLKSNNCNDRIFAYIKKNGNKLEEVKWDGEGCAIFSASSSFIVENLKEINDIKKGKEFLDLFKNSIENDNYKNEFKIFSLLKKHKSRKKCVLFVIEAFKEELEKI